MSIMLPPDTDENNGARGWRAYDLTPDMVAPLLERFGWYYERSSDDDCWIWGGPYFKTTGYGKISRSSRYAAGQHILAHRFAWVAATGEALVDEITIDHLCVNRLCVNPAHLEPVTMSVNAARRSRRPDGERTYPRLADEDVAGARERAAGRVRLLHAEKVQRDREAYARHRAKVLLCQDCGRAMRRDNLSKHRASGCPALVRPNKAPRSLRADSDPRVCVSSRHGGCGMVSCHPALLDEAV